MMIALGTGEVVTAYIFHKSTKENTTATRQLTDELLQAWRWKQFADDDHILC